jgi:hypothetical protein
MASCSAQLHPCRRKASTSPILKLFLSRLDELVAPNHKH